MWERRVKEHRRQNGLLEKAAQRMRSSGIDKSWALWLDNATELRRQRRMLSTVTARMRYACVYAAFDAMQVTRLRQNLGKVAARMQLGGLCKSWAIWRNVATLDRIDRVCKRVFERTRSMMLVGVGDTAILRSYNPRMAVSRLFGWRLATKDAMAVCQRRMPFSRTSSFLVRKYERAVCARAISC
jgi:hypothetical protein